jgi:hypothetical protein
MDTLHAATPDKMAAYRGERGETATLSPVASSQYGTEYAEAYTIQQQPQYKGHLPTAAMYPQLTNAQRVQHQQHPHVVQSQPQVQQYAGQQSPVVIYVQQPQQYQQQQQQQYDPEEFNSGFCSCCADCGVCCQVTW